MRKSIFYLSAVATMAFVSCAQDETIEINQGKDIRFNVLTNSMTRAADVDIKSLGSFKVETLQGETVKGASPVWKDTYTTKDGGTSFNGAATHFWPGDNTPLHFFAYNDALSNSTVTINGTTQTITGVKPATTANAQKDLVVAYATGNQKTNGTSGVTVNFKHAFTKVVIQGKNDKSTSLKVEVLGVRLNGVNSTADLTLPTTSTNTDASTSLAQSIWSVTNNTTNKDGDYKALPSKGLSTSLTPVVLNGTAQSLMDVTADDKSNKYNNAFMVLPQQLTKLTPGNAGSTDVNGAYISVLCRISQSDGNSGWTQMFPPVLGTGNEKNKGKYAWTAVPIDENWQPGTCYTYTLDFSNGAGTTDPDQPTKPTDPEVPVDPNKPVLGSEISISVSVSKWTDSAISQPM